MWENLSLRYKMALAFLVSGLCFSAFLFFVFIAGNFFVNQSTRSLDEALHAIRMGARESDHLLWLQRISTYIDSPHADRSMPELGETRCEFGHWLQSADRRKMEALTPQHAARLTRLEEPHRRLHQSATSIVNLIQRGDKAAAREIFEHETMRYSTDVVGFIHEIRVDMYDALKGEQEGFRDLLLRAKVSGLIGFSLFVFGCFSIWKFLNASFYAPLQRIVDVARRVSGGDREARVRMRCGDEIGEIASTLDEMLNGLCAKMEENEVRMREQLRLDRQLKAVNQMAELLLSRDDVNFDVTVWQALQGLGIATQADRVYMWADKIGEDGRRYCDQLYEWAGGAQPMQNDLAVDISYDEVIPRWGVLFASGKCVNDLVSRMPLSEQEQLAPQGILSLLVAPIILDKQVWGFIGFDNCRTERIWSEGEEEILRAGGVIMAAAIRRHRLTLELTDAKEKAEDATTAKSDFLARMSHEIRTPMNAILGVSYMALQRERDKAIRKDFTLIRSSASSLLNIINDILDFSKIEARKLDLEIIPFNLRKELSAVFDVLRVRAEEKGIDAGWCVGEDVPDSFLGDPVRIRQVILNLAGNAVKFTERGGVQLDVELLRLSLEGATLRFCVEDTGIGLSGAEIDKLFSPFTQSDGSITRRYGGTGLGLVICKELVEMMGGKVQVESQPGFGSVFSFTLTLELAEVEGRCAEGVLASEEIPDLTGKSILLVEDNEINSMIAAAVLEQTGAVISFAFNGQEAIEAVKKDSYDLVLMDIQMPVMDGLEAARHMRTMPELSPTLPIVAMTAHAMRSDYLKSLEAGMNDHVTKPIEPPRLFAVIHKLLTQGTGGRA